MIKSCLKGELRYIYYSKIFYATLIALILSFSIVLFMNYQSVKDINTQFNSYIEYYEENGFDINEDLSQGYSITENELGREIQNPVAYYKSILGQYAYAASPQYTLSQMLESSIILFPIIFGIFGLCIGSYDFKYKTVKIKGLRFSRLGYTIAKQLALLIGAATILVVGLIVAIILGRIMFLMLGNDLDVDAIITVLLKRNSIMKVVFAYLLGILFSKIGYSFGLIFKNVAIGVVAIIGYAYLLPNLGRYDLKNSIHLLSAKVFDFYGVVSLDKYHETLTIFSVLIILTMLMILSMIDYLTIENRSMYE